MGSYLSSVASVQDPESSCTLIRLPLSEIREYHGSYKSIRSNFGINLTAFETIFQSN